jgi:hypothetical protein
VAGLDREDEGLNLSGGNEGLTVGNCAIRYSSRVKLLRRVTELKKIGLCIRMTHHGYLH